MLRKFIPLGIVILLLTTAGYFFRESSVVKAPVDLLNSNFNPVLGIKEKELFDLTNQVRKKAGLNVLARNSLLDLAAELKLNDMVTNNYWSHDNQKNLEPWIFFHKAGYTYLYAGESLAKGYTVSESIFHAWMKSEKHKENILKKEYTEMGISLKRGKLGGEKSLIVVQLFATPIKPVEDLRLVAIEIDRKTVQDYLDNLNVSRESWITNNEKYSKRDMDVLIDNFDRRIQLCKKIISNIDSQNRSESDILSLWNEVVKISNESTVKIKEITAEWDRAGS
jgi:hypothetical protein